MKAISEIPPLLASIYLFRCMGMPFARRGFGLKRVGLLACDPSERPCQVGSLAGAAHLLNDNAGVLRGAQ